MSDFTTTFQIEKPAYGTLRFDVPINADFDLIDDGLKCFPSSSEPGSVGNHDPIVLTEGILWRDTGNHLLKVRGAAAWETIFTNSNITVITVDGSGSTDITNWITALLDGSATAADNPKYALKLNIGGVDYYIPAFLTA